MTRGNVRVKDKVALLVAIDEIPDECIVCASVNHGPNVSSKTRVDRPISYLNYFFLQSATFNGIARIVRRKYVKKLFATSVRA